MLNCDLCSHYVCWLVNYVDEHGYQQAMPLDPTRHCARAVH